MNHDSARSSSILEPGIKRHAAIDENCRAMDSRSRRWCRRRGSNPHNSFRLRSLHFATLCKNACYVRKIKMRKSRRSEQKRRETKNFCHQLSSKNSTSNENSWRASLMPTLLQKKLHHFRMSPLLCSNQRNPSLGHPWRYLPAVDHWSLGTS